MKLQEYHEPVYPNYVLVLLYNSQKLIDRLYFAKGVYEKLLWADVTKISSGC